MPLGISSDTALKFIHLSFLSSEKAPSETSAVVSEEAEIKDEKGTEDTQAAEEEEAEGAETAEAAEAAEAEEPSPLKVKEKKLANQFNFIERSSRTLDNPLRVRCCCIFLQ
ncbi:hypothetical protein CIB84_012081 [Bambusicola thoracicus]|uniref:Uncharacterized protein n=1 Tax=Bambusicola thoracicus TaxID=9083 RepID=A0A2P4SJ81_BAMTH|nr:hypothetical protein CIB84_012081 [Bambusicola thoracicus]